MTPVRSERYSPLRHLAWAIWLNHDPRDRYMAMFTAYYDASGAPKRPGAMFVSGVVSSIEKWLAFEEEWPTLLERHGVRRPFHMTDFVRPDGEYKEWAGDLKRQAVFLTDIRESIKKHVLVTLSQGIVLADFERLHAEYVVPTAWATPLSYCAFGAWHQLQEWGEHHLGMDDKVEHVYESGDSDWGTFVELARTIYGFTPIPRNKGDAAPMELCDHLAWEHRHWIEEREKNPHRRTRGSLLALANELPGSDLWGYGHWDKLRGAFDELEMPRRQ